jgi:hypothetical protein
VAVLALLALGVSDSGCAAGFVGRELRGPYAGQVIDAEISQPIAGAVALAVWWEVVPTLVHGTRRFYDAREAVTGPNGRFEIPSAVPFGNVSGRQPGQVTIFAPGYREEAVRVTPPDGPEFVAPTVVLMRRLTTRQERISHVGRFPPNIPYEKAPRMLEAVNRERMALGLVPIGGVR